MSITRRWTLAACSLGLLIIGVPISHGKQNPPAEPKLKKMSFSFHVTDNDKDWDTRVGAEVVCNNHDVAQRFDFNHDKNVDHWSDNTDHGPWDLPVSENPTRGELNKCIYRVSAQANANDEWHFEAHLHADFDDGTKRDWTFLGGNLNSVHYQQVSQTFPMGDHYK